MNGLPFVLIIRKSSRGNLFSLERMILISRVHNTYNYSNNPGNTTAGNHQINSHNDDILLSF